MSERKNVYIMRQEVPEHVRVLAQDLAREESRFWPFGKYTSDDFAIMHEKGFYAGYVAAVKEENEHFARKYGEALRDDK